MKYLIGFITTPLLGGLLLTLTDYISSGSFGLTLANFVACFVFSAFPGTLIAYVLAKQQETSIVWYFISGCLLALISVSTILQIVPFLNIGPYNWLSYMAQYWAILLVGVICGGYYFFITRRWLNA
ncbi:hypothetical protein G8770_19675 [Aestuariicella hydrocarbonica]|uniref:Uncharacterized protein n=1 Tax=Pseudomaricurvus hydrocarbonicus TaxID=1470433 RepID=A0A9E5T488_9GAMM|nr:hypothetical protein [Aestuariicella hydrocarbonica]NHO67772.1 hypothetical protein [Aestuariicella hydrocarbonica]